MTFPEFRPNVFSMELVFVYFRSSSNFYTIKIVDVSVIRTRIVRVEGKHADHHCPDV